MPAVKMERVMTVERLTAGELTVEIERDPKGVITTVRIPFGKRNVVLPALLIERMAAMVARARERPGDYQHPYNSDYVCAVHGYHPQYQCSACKQAEEAERVAQKLDPTAEVDFAAVKPEPAKPADPGDVPF